MALLINLLVLGALSFSEARVLPRFSTPVSAREVAATSYDYVIVGGGISGLTVADRLTENPGGV
jgi:ribulose 1,5-bisphosphate synthetase/thiazole synthase